MSTQKSTPVQACDVVLHQQAEHRVELQLVTLQDPHERILVKDGSRDTSEDDLEGRHHLAELPAAHPVSEAIQDSPWLLDRRDAHALSFPVQNAACGRRRASRPVSTTAISVGR